MFHAFDIASCSYFRGLATRLQRLNISLNVSVGTFSDLLYFLNFNIVPFFGSSIITASYSLQYSRCLFKDFDTKKGSNISNKNSVFHYFLALERLADTLDYLLDSNASLHLLLLIRELYYYPYPYKCCF